MKEFKKGEFWFFCWLFGKKKIEVYLLDDKNKLIVWDEKKNQWVNLNELEEEKKVLFLFLILLFKVVQVVLLGFVGFVGVLVNMFFRRVVGSRVCYVDVLNLSGIQWNELVFVFVDFVVLFVLFLIFFNLFVLSLDVEELQFLDGIGREGFVLVRGLVNLEFVLEFMVFGDFFVVGGFFSGVVFFYNFVQLVQVCVIFGSLRLGRIDQRKYLVQNQVGFVVNLYLEF